MAGTDGSTCIDVSAGEGVPPEPVLDVSRYNFYQLVELLNQMAVAWQNPRVSAQASR
ncbi:Uncharacterised protein [Serratia fonticola]|uniref:Uncharacterized protein n=1 Tax=Serratia fonticola TaxID=47917 RepID=A0A4U9TBS6_SERFO|nr:Uncharacterised protein [Serratia fonticola]